MDDRRITWVKSIVTLCISSFKTEEEKINSFLEMEEEYNQFTDEDKKYIRSTITTKFEGNDAIYILFIIVDYIKNEDFREDLMDCILRGEFDCFTGSALWYQILYFVKGNYRRKRILYRKNMHEFAKVLDINYPYISLGKRNKKRIVLFAGQVLNARHSPTKLLLDIAYILQKELNFEILIFVCPCNFRELQQDLCYKVYFENSYDFYSDQTLKIEYRNIILNGYQIDMRRKNLKEYHMMFSLIHAWNPYFILDLNTANPVVGLGGRFTTLVSLPMSMECPVSEGEILVRYAQLDEESEKKYAEALEDSQVQLIMKEKCPVLAENSYNNFTRRELGLPENKFLIAVVGNRLDQEIDREFVQTMKKILDKLPIATFVMIGDNVIKEYFEDDIFKGRIHFLGYCKDLIGVYQVLNLYLNPRRMGGGFSAGMALQAGLSVVTLPDCDVYDVVNCCGEAFVVQDYQEMIETVGLYVNNLEFCERQKKYIKEYQAKNGEEQMIRWVKELLRGVTQIMEECVRE